jgi:hypothetical protein
MIRVLATVHPEQMEDILVLGLFRAICRGTPRILRLRDHDVVLVRPVTATTQSAGRAGVLITA